MKVKESEALGSKRQTSSFKYRPTSRLSHPGPKSSLTFRNPTALAPMLLHLYVDFRHIFAFLSVYLDTYMTV